MASYTEKYDQPYHIVVEGADDREFIKRILRAHNIDGYQVGCGQDKKDYRCLGKSGFIKRIEAILGATTVDVEGYIIVADCDDDPNDRFSKAVDQFRDIGLPRPAKAFEIKRGQHNKKDVKTAVVMIPQDMSQGGLETILLACCDEILDYRDCIDAFCKCVETPNRKKLDSEKVRLRATIAATHRDDPSLALSSWVTSKHRPFELTGKAPLNFLVDFFNAFKSA